MINRRKSFFRNNNRNLAGYVFITPWLIGFFGFLFFPILMAIFYSFTNYNIMSSPVWVGFSNYIEIFTGDSKFWQSIKVTFVFVTISLPLRLMFALLLAILFNQKRKLVGLYRTIFYVPSLIGGSVAVAVVWRQLFGMNGALNSVLLSLGILEYPIGYIGDPRYSLWTLIILMVWQFGSPMLIFLAGLKQIPIQLYEAAVIDGCNWWQKFFRITLPMLTPVIFFNMINQLIGLFLMFTQAYIITKGGPIDSTLVYMLYLFKRGFEYSQLGYACALAVILLAIIGLITLLIFKTSSTWVYYEAEGDLV